MKRYSLYIITIPLTIASLALIVWLGGKNDQKLKPEKINVAPVISQASKIESEQESSVSEVDSTSNSSEALIERYGVLRRFSTSGDMRFYYYDIKQNRELDSWKSYPWFFAMIKDIEDDKSLDEYVQYVQSNKDSVFKIVGKKDKDDCDYYGDGRCLENIIVERIEAVAK